MLKKAKWATKVLWRIIKSPKATTKKLARTIRYTRNFWDAFFLKAFGGKRNIKFRNGLSMELSWTEYCRMRDWLQHLNSESFAIIKHKTGYYIKRTTPELSFFTDSIFASRSLFEFVLSLDKQGWTVKQVDNGTFEIWKAGKEFSLVQEGENEFAATSKTTKIVGPLESMEAFFCECESGIYDCNFDDKTVLDVGGFCGETAVFFKNRGAKKVIVYEPVSEHHDLIKKNIALNKVNTELHEEGIGEEDGSETIHYESLSVGFGVLNRGKNELNDKNKNATNIISESNADIAKIDCEGAETSLINVPSEILRRIRFYIIETHSHKIQEAITQKFLSSGFNIARDPVPLTKDISIVYFEIAKQVQ